MNSKVVQIVNNNVQQPNNINNGQVVNNTNQIGQIPNVQPMNNQVPNNTVNQNNQSVQNTPEITTNFTNNTEKNKSIKMIRFKYKAKDADGKIIDSYFDAESKTDVEHKLDGAQEKLKQISAESKPDDFLTPDLYAVP